MFSHIHSVRHSEIYLPTFGYIWADQPYSESWLIFMLDIFLYIKLYSEPMTYLGIFSTAGIFSQFQAHYSGAINYLIN